jgi:cobalt/nickel transport system ATP-binding protein
LSFGERKRIAIATVLAMEPKVLVLDEPTANLDPRSRRQLLSLLRRLEITKIVATHDLDAALFLCDKAILMDDGQIVAIGETREIFSDEALMEAHGLEVPPSILALQSRSD